MATVTASLGGTRGFYIHPRVCVGAVLLSSAVHLWGAVSRHHPWWMSLFMIAMVAVCLPCALHIWQASSVKALHNVAACAVGMAGLHLLLILAAPSTGHAHGAESRSFHGGASATQTLMIIALEISLALIATTLVARLRAAHRTKPALVRNDQLL